MGIRPVGHDDRLSIVEHLDELRSRLIVCVAALVACFALCWWQADTILDIVNKPLEDSQQVEDGARSQDPLEQSVRFQLETADAFAAIDPALRRTGAALERLEGVPGVPADVIADLRASAAGLQRAAQAARDAAAAVPADRGRQPVTLGVAEPFTTTITVAGYAALLLALPVILLQAYAFVVPAFTRDERRAALPLMGLVPALFAAGIAFGYFVALPRAVDFLQNFNDDSFDILIGARDYYRFVVMFLLLIGLLFQIPVGVLLVTRLGVISSKTLRAQRGYVILVLAIIAAIATPTPDPVTMLIALAPLVILFELSVQLARIFEPKDAIFRFGSGWDDEHLGGRDDDLD